MLLEAISFKKLDCYIGRRNVRVIDLRTPEAFLEGHIKGAENIPYGELENHKCNFHKGEVIIFYCDRGNNSLLACRDISRYGIYTKAVIGIFAEYRGKYLVS